MSDSAATFRRRLRIEGRVQGVGFRWFTCEVARATGVAGWVRNLHDGSVLCEAQGGAAALDAFAARLRQGPRHARVARVEVEDLEPEPGASGFEISG